MLVTVTYFGQRCSRRLSVWLTSAPGTTVQMHCERALVACKAPRQPSVEHVNANTYADMIDLTLALTSEAVQVRSKHGLQYQLCTGDLSTAQLPGLNCDSHTGAHELDPRDIWIAMYAHVVTKIEYYKVLRACRGIGSSNLPVMVECTCWFGCWAVLHLKGRLNSEARRAPKLLILLMYLVM